MIFMLILYIAMLKKQKAGKPFNCGADICCRDTDTDTDKETIK